MRYLNFQQSLFSSPANASWICFFLSPEIDAGADEKQDIYFYWPYYNTLLRFTTFLYTAYTSYPNSNTSNF